MERSNNMSLTVLVIVLAMLGLLVGYLLGNWFIQLVTGGTETQHLADSGNRVVEEEIILEDDSSDSEESISNYFSLDDSQGNSSNNQNLNNNSISQSQQFSTQGLYVLQVGAFNSRQNALSLTSELQDKGFQAVIAEGGVPYKVQIKAFNNREEAEDMQKEVEALGYDSFITH
ncbi:SPOR domain-containing protein [Natronospora cellulosivora (SeqCode)]